MTWVWVIFLSFFLIEFLIDNPATRILASWYLLEQDSPSYPPTNFDAFNPDNDETNEHIDVQYDHYKLVRTLGAASTVLLKNERGVLPLGKKDRSIVIVGSDAGPGIAGPNQFADQVRFSFFTPWCRGCGLTIKFVNAGWF